VGRLPGVRVAAPVLRENAEVLGPGGRRPVQLVGVTPRLVALGGEATQNLGAGASLLSGGVGLPSGVAGMVGARAGGTVTLAIGGVTHSIRVAVVLGSGAIGPVANSPIVVALLPVAQRLAGRPGRVSEVFIESQRGEESMVEGEVKRLAAGRLNVTVSDGELRLLEEAAKPNNQSTALLAAISVMVGFLLATNAMLLTVPERRRFVADLRVQGYDWRQIVLILGFEALALGAIASLVGVVLGDAVSQKFFHVPAYLAFAFPIGTQQVIQASSVLLAVGCGVFATLLASLRPVLDLWPSRPHDAVYRAAGDGSERIGRRLRAVLGGMGLFLVCAVAVLVFFLPDASVEGGVVLAVGSLLLIPIVFAGVAGALTRVTEHVRGSALIVATRELDATSTRSIALAGIAALAVYGSITVGGAQHDLIHGLDQATVQDWNTADVWVMSGENIFLTDGFRAGGASRALERSPDVASVRAYQGGFLDVGTHRLWIRARPPQSPTMLLSTQLIQGGLTHATQLLRQGGWAAVSSGFADEHHLTVGSVLTLPTPAGTARLGVAAITTNIGWSSGTITMSTSDYSRDWQTAEPVALAVTLKPGVSPTAGRRAVARIVEQALGPQPGLQVLTAGQRIAQIERNARQGLRSLSEIANLILLAAALAIAAALSASIWQRRARLASLKIVGYDRRQLWRALLLESVIVLGIGCAVGVVLGIYGHALASKALKLTTGYPAPFSLGGTQILLALTLVGSIALVVVALPGLLAARVPARTSLQE
jgi:putative ABC transport system permease protein